MTVLVVAQSGPSTTSDRIGTPDFPAGIPFNVLIQKAQILRARLRTVLRASRACNTIPPATLRVVSFKEIFWQSLYIASKTRDYAIQMHGKLHEACIKIHSSSRSYQTHATRLHKNRVRHKFAVLVHLWGRRALELTAQGDLQRNSAKCPMARPHSCSWGTIP